MSAVGVAAVVARVQGRLGRAVLLAVTLWACIALGVVLSLAWILAGPEGWRQGTAGPLLLDATLAGLLLVGVPIVFRLRKRWLAESRIARALEEATGLSQGTVLGSLELSRHLPSGASSGLAAFAERGVLERLHAHPDAHLAGGLRRRIEAWTRGGMAGLAVLTPLLVLLTLATPGRTLTAWSGLSSPLSLLSQPKLLPLVVHPGTVEVPRGESVRVSVEAPGRAEVTLHWQAAGDVPQAATSLLDEGEGAAFELPSITAPVRYWASAPDGSRSGEFHLSPVDPLFVSDLRIEISYPRHVGRLPEEFRGEAPPLTLPAGTRIGIDGRASRTLSEGSLRLRAGDSAHPLSINGSGFSTLWVPARSGTWDWAFEGLDGSSAELTPRPMEITIVPDAPPQVRFTYPARDTVLPLSLRQPLVIEVSDDYGVARLEVVAYRTPNGGAPEPPVTLPVEVGETREASLRPELDLAGWGLLPGDQVHYRARAFDNGPGAQSAETQEWVLRVPGAAELRREAQEQIEEAARRVEELADQAARAAEETRNLQRQAAGDRTGSQQSAGAPEVGGFQQREDVRRALERQEGLTGEVDALRSELQALSEAMRDAGLADPGLRSDLEELQRLLSETSTPELRQQLSDMGRDLDGMDSRQAQQALQDLGAAQQELRQRLEESLERFRRAAVEQDFRATTSEAEDLARLERALAEAMRNADDVALRAEQQAELTQRADEMGDRMQQLEQRLRQLGEEDAAGGVEAGRQSAEQARSAMQEAERQARAGQSQQAGEQAQRAAESMEQAARDLGEARQDMASQRADAVRQAMEGAAEEALGLARRQSELRDRMQGASAAQMADLRGDVAAVLQGARSLGENLAEATQQSGSGPVGERAQGAMTALEQALSALDRRPGGGAQAAAAAADRAVDALNQLALTALAGAQSGQGEGSPGDLMEQLEALAQQQGQLNSESGQMMPMQLGQQALQAQLQNVTQGQESVAGQLGELANDPGSDQVLGDLQALAQEARELAERLGEGRLDAETRQRQERLFHRLLDAGRSLEKEDEISEQRESRTGRVVEGREVAPLEADAVGGQRYRLPDAEVLQRLSPAERQLVIQYFDRLNRDAPRPAPASGAGGGQ